MKAVIMAGGEGSRLRPLTSNQPKPMAPLVNRPMMEHIVTLLRKHGFDDIVVTVAFMASTIRTYFGDGSEFGVRIQYAIEEEPLGTAGSVRNAKDVLDERFLVISGDVLTDVDLSAIVDFHDEQGAIATIGLAAVENPLEFGIVITRDDGSIERFLEKPTWGQVFSDTINTGIYVLEPEVFDYIPDGEVGRLLGRGVPDHARRRQAALRRGGRRLLGGRRHARGLRPGPQGRPRRQRRGRDRRVRAAARRLARRGGRDPPRGQGRGPGGDRRELPHRGRGPAGRVHRARLQRAGTRERRPRAGRHPRQRLPRAGRAAPRGGDRPVVRPAGTRPGGGGRRARRRGLRRRERGARPRRQDLPVQDRRGRRRGQHLDRVGDPRAPAACSAATAWPAWPTSTSAPSWPPSWPWPTPHAQEGLDGRHLPRLEPLGPHAQAGDDGRAQRGGRQRPRPRGGLGARHPLRRPPAERRRGR